MFPFALTYLFERGPYYNCIKIYNALPPKLEIAANIHAFKNDIKKFLIESVIYLLGELYSFKYVYFIWWVICDISISFIHFLYIFILNIFLPIHISTLILILMFCLYYTRSFYLWRWQCFSLWNDNTDFERYILVTYSTKIWKNVTK